LLVKSDHEQYAAVIADVLGAAPGLAAIDPGDGFAGLPETGFEHKYLADGRIIHSFALEKRN
jgi:hypothetical protein